MAHLASAVVFFCFAVGTVSAAQAEGQRVNLLFIITDQQRFDALGCAGNPVLKTPNLDRLAREGARFVNAYSSCPVCVPARTTILTGHSIGSTTVATNRDVTREDVPSLLTFDQVLLQNGYKGEYHGKWHSPYKFALAYTEPVLWLNGKTPLPGSKATISETEAFMKYVAAHVPARELRPGERIASLYGCPYVPDLMDPAHGSTNVSRERAPQGTMFGCLRDVPPEHSLAAWPVKEAFKALAATIRDQESLAGEAISAGLEQVPSRKMVTCGGPMASAVSALSSIVANLHLFGLLWPVFALAGRSPHLPFFAPSACPSRGFPQPESAMTTRPNHPLPRQDLHLQACQRPKAAHKNLLFARPVVLSAARVRPRLPSIL